MANNFFKKEKSFAKKKENPLLDIVVYWRIGVCCMFTIFIGSAGMGYHFFQKVNKEASQDGIGTVQSQSIKKERIDKALQYFKDRQQESHQILYSPTTVIDPSQ